MPSPLYIICSIPFNPCAQSHCRSSFHRSALAVFPQIGSNPLLINEGLFKFLLKPSAYVTKPKIATMTLDSLLANLPLDLIHENFEVCGLSGRILLSQSGSNLWQALRFEATTAVGFATSNNCIGLTQESGNTSPDYQFCTTCKTPLLGEQVHPRVNLKEHSSQCRQQNPPEHTCSRYSVILGYNIAYHHVQLAMKYSRSDEIYPSYRKNVLQKFTTSLSSHNPLSLDFIAEPRIVSGRFLLMMSFTFYDGNEPVCSAVLGSKGFRICPHIAFGPPLTPNESLSQAIDRELQLDNGETTIDIPVTACNYCASDYKVTIKSGRWTFRVWQDLGAGASPDDPYWKSIIGAKDDWYKYLNTRCTCEPGSIKARYESAAKGKGTPTTNAVTGCCIKRKISHSISQIKTWFTK